MSERIYDVAIVGGGPAGLSAAIWLGRYLHDVVVVDSGDPRNWETHGINGYLGLPGVRPAELRGAGRDEARKYGATLIDGFAVRARKESDDRFVLERIVHRLKARELRQIVSEQFVVLYLVAPRSVHLLAVRDQRQAAFRLG